MEQGIRISKICQYLKLSSIIYYVNLIMWVLVGTPEGKEPLGRPGSRWENNVNFGSSGSRMWVVWTECSWIGIETVGGHL